MMSPFYAALEWLPRLTKEFDAELRSLDLCEGGLGNELRALARHGLDINQLNKLAKAIKKARSAGKSLHPLVPFKLALLSNSTVDFIIPALIASATRHGIDLDIILPSYDQVAQEALTPDSKTNSSKPDAVLFATDYRALPLRLSLGDPKSTAATVDAVLDYLKVLRTGIKSNCNAVCIFQTFAPPAEPLFGSLDRALPGTLRNLLDAVNRELAQTALANGDVLFDVAVLAETVGLANWHCLELWNLGKFPFADELVPLYADHVARTVAAMCGMGGKALILDLDDTIWGGVIGDDGLEGIKISQGDACGEAHLAIQRMALELRQRGIVLAVSSKNTYEVACEPFLKHPEMLLKLDHIAVFHANWNEKATNIQAIAEELSLGLEAMVFLDNNPAERKQVRDMLPQVAVPELPDDPALYPRTLAAGGFFEAVTFADEDLKRARYYQDNCKRVSLQKTVGGIDAFLESLDMTITFMPFDATGRARIVQLINKSHQYNLTTRRYSDPEVVEAENDSQVFTLQVRLADIFGDNGMISVVICRPVVEACWEIDTWLMSCRVLGRKVENMVLNEVLRHAHLAGIRKLLGVYIPTGRNQLVIEHYAKLGFTKVAEEGSGATRWEIAVERAKPEALPIRVASRQFAFVREESIA
jgi:FkbH-like protein